MSNYIEINSTYRNRNLWPIPGQFEVPIGPSYNDNKNTAVDPISEAEPLISFTTDYLATSYETIPAKIGSNTPLDNTMSPNVIVLRMLEFNPQQTTDYLVGLNLWNLINNARSRINNYIYLGLNTSGEPILLIKVDDEIQYNIDDDIKITDFTTTTGSVTQLFLPNGNNDDDSYLNYYIYDESYNIYGKITKYIGKYHLLTISSNFNFSALNNNYSIRKDLPIIPPVDINFIPLSISTYNKIYISYNTIFSKIKNYYKNYFIRLRPGGYNVGLFIPYFNGNNLYGEGYQNIKSHTRRIIYYEYDGTNCIFTVENEFEKNINLLNYTIEILPFSYDNFNPLTYTGTLVQQPSCYEFELVNLILPNQILSVGNGSKIAFYPFVYVEITNVSSSSSHLINTIYSNNPNATKMVFRVPIYDVQDPATTPFVRLVASNMIQTIKFKPDDNLLFSVRLPNGDIYNTIIPENYSPSSPNQKIQISVLFRFKRVI